MIIAGLSDNLSGPGRPSDDHLFGFPAVSRIALPASIVYARYIRLVRFSFLILVSRFATLES